MIQYFLSKVKISNGNGYGISKKTKSLVKYMNCK